MRPSVRASSIEIDGQLACPDPQLSTDGNHLPVQLLPLMVPTWRSIMPRGEKSKYTGKQERKADHIAEGYKKRGVSSDEAERRAWATVNKDDGGGKKAGGSGRGKRTG